MLEHTDDEHSITTDDLIRIYEENGYKANRNTIRDDVAVLNAAGIEILSERVGNGKVYHIPYDGKLYFVFDFNVPQVFHEKPKKGEEPLDENGEVVQVDTRKGYYSEDIANTFGVPMEQYKKETEVKEMDGFVEIAMLTGVRERNAEAGDQSDAPAQSDVPPLSDTPTQPDQ